MSEADGGTKSYLVVGIQGYRCHSPIPSSGNQPTARLNPAHRAMTR